MNIKPHKNKSLQNIEGEEWLIYPDNTQYLASSCGRVKSLEQIVNHNSGGKATKKERIMTQTDNGSGYLSVGLTQNGKTKTTRVSRIIACTFHPNPESKPQVNHIDGDKYNNHKDNLEWNTVGENIKHSWANGLAKKQSEYLYIENRFKQINSYISFQPRVKTPYGLGTVIIDQNCYRIQYDNGKIENLVKSVRFWRDDFKLCLRNLSDLTKEIEHNGERFVPIRWFELNGYAPAGLEMDGETFVFGDSIMWSVEEIHYNMVQKLFEWHFDIFDLIPQGLAININQL